MRRLYLWQVLKILFKSSKVATGALLLIKILSGLFQSVMIVVFADFLNTVLGIYNSVERNRIYIVFLIIIYVSLQLFVWLEPNISEWFKVRLLAKVRKECGKEILNKYSHMQYRYIENSTIQDLTNRVVSTADEKIIECYESYLNIFRFIVKIVGVLVVLASEAFLTSMILICCTVPLFILAVKSGRASYEVVRDATNSNRKAEYFSEIMMKRDYVYERKLFHYGQYINEQWRDNFENARILKLKTSFKWYLKSKAGSVFTALISIVVAITLIEPVLIGEMSAGMYISLVGSIYTLVKVMAWEFMQSVDDLTRVNEWMKDFNSFFAIEEERRNEYNQQPLKGFELLEFKNVSFKYPGTNNYILQNLSLVIEANKKYSIVGINGAGKTTMIKLILGLYDDYEGTILLNGKDIKNYSKEQVRALCSTVFQDFAKYSLSIRDNVRLGSLQHVKKINNKDIEKIIREVGLSVAIDEGEEGLDTLLGNEFKGGQEFSGGQWQRLALARSLIGDAELIILDEPTSMLDPIAEKEFYDLINLACKKKTVITISHRLAVTQNADCIFVLENGVVCEKGDFQQLLEANKKFAKMYESQKEWYDEKK